MRSSKQLKAFFGHHGLLPLFRKGGKYSFDKKTLATYHRRHSAIALIRPARRIFELKQERLLTGEFDGVDGRIHPEYKPLGTHTGRQTSRIATDFP